MQTVLVTGAKGVIGTVLWRALQEAGWAVTPFDVAFAPGTASHGDIRDRTALDPALGTCDGIIHLAAVSRVISGERDLDACQSVNVEGTRILLEAAAASARRPWLVFISSCQVYGSPSRLPVVEDEPMAPVNAYGRSKAAGEELVAEARAKGLRGVILRLPNVYGPVSDYPDRAAPAFARQALEGKPLHVTGASQVYDFLHLSDTVDGIARAAGLLAEGASGLPTMNLATGRATSLQELAQLARELAVSDSPILAEQPRPFDALGYVGSPLRAREVLGWAARIPIEVGMARLVSQFAGLSSSAECSRDTSRMALQAG